MVTVLMTAFDPFGGETVNPAREALLRVTQPQGVRLACLTVPTVFDECEGVLAAAMEEAKPDAVICVGQAGGRSAVTPERVAVNIMDAAIPDNAGRIPVDEPIVPGGEAAYFSTLPIKRIRDAIRSAGIASEISNSAGTFVCNRLMYGALRLCAAEYPGVIAGFIHVPYLPEQAKRAGDAPSMELADDVLALEIAARVTADFVRSVRAKERSNI